LFLVILIAVTPSQAQSPGTSGVQSTDNAAPSGQIQASGCLRRGNDGGYYLKDRNGQSWALSSTKVDLSQHIMHSVSITGKITKPQAGETGSSGGKPSPSLEVLTLTVLSPSCTR
jgi:hypothetical protein